jgi:hypothetical protein
LRSILRASAASRTTGASRLLSLLIQPPAQRGRRHFSAPTRAAEWFHREVLTTMRCPRYRFNKRIALFLPKSSHCRMTRGHRSTTVLTKASRKSSYRPPVTRGWRQPTYRGSRSCSLSAPISREDREGCRWMQSRTTGVERGLPYCDVDAAYPLVAEFKNDRLQELRRNSQRRLRPC